MVCDGPPRTVRASELARSVLYIHTQKSVDRRQPGAVGVQLGGRVCAVAVGVGVVIVPVPVLVIVAVA